VRQAPPGAAALRRGVAAAAASGEAETLEYQAEVSKLMDLIVNSLYSNKDVFLRELVSNASDALDKVRFEGVSDPKALEGLADLKIEVKADEEAKTVTIRDTGVGMTRQELLDALGTIANSGTAKFAAALKESQENHDANLIGQFGVGFYSAFLVADRVRVQTKSYKEGEQWVWEGKSGSTTYSVEPDTSGEDLVRGTQITLYVREESHDICSHLKLQELIRQYSNFIEFPIQLWASKSVNRQVEDVEATKKAQEEADKALGEGEEPKPVDPVMKTEYDTVFDWATQNDTKPLWLRSPKEVEEEEYNAFFKSTFKEFLDPVAHNHFNVEGTIEFSGMIFIPGTAGFDQSGEMMQSRNIKLYVKRVFISDEFDDSLMPRYLSFVKGVVDSSDLPLNVSREILQESRVTRIVRKQLVKRTLDTLKQLSGREDQTSWNTFWEAFGRNLKLGVIEDAANREALSKLLRFPTSHGEEQTSLADYVSRMKEGQQGIFFLPAATKDAAEASPFAEGLLKKGFEVLFLTEPIDEVAVSNLADFEEKKFIDVTKEGLDLGDGEEADDKGDSKEMEGLLSWVKDVLGAKVESVVVSRRLGSSPCAVVTSQTGWSANMERIMKAQAMGDNRSFEFMKGKKILEVNPSSPVIQALVAKSAAGKADQEGQAMVDLLYETALITSGFEVESPKDYAARVYDMISSAAAAGGAGSPEDPEVIEPDNSDPFAK